MISVFRTDFLRAFGAVGNTPSKGHFIDGCYAHCQTGTQETWLRNDSPVLGSTVRNCIRISFLKYVCIKISL